MRNTEITLGLDVLELWLVRELEDSVKLVHGAGTREDGLAWGRSSVMASISPGASISGPAYCTRQ